MLKRNLGVFSSQIALKNNPNQQVYSGNTPDYKSIHERNERSDSKSKSKVKDYSLNYGHNPIINPTPFNIQNPYLRKEYQKFLNPN